MPRVHVKTKSTRGESYRCSKCSEPIVAGQKYFEWTFYKSSPTRTHAEHGSPKQSELTQSKMSGVYSAIESAEETISSCDLAEVADALRACAEEVDSVKEEYQSSKDNMPEQLQESGSAAEMINEKLEGLEAFVDALNSSADEVDDLHAEFEDLDEPDVPADHTEDCPVSKVENGEASEGECDCGKDDKEHEHDEFEAEQERLEHEIREKASEGLSELNV